MTARTIGSHSESAEGPVERDSLLRRTLDTLLTPLSTEFADSWRDEVIQYLRRWVGTDCAFFRVSDGSPTRIAPFTEELLQARDDYRDGGFRSLDPWATCRVGPGEVLIGSFRDLLGEDWQESNEYYRKFLLGHGITSYVGVQIGTEMGEHLVLSFFNFWKPEDEFVIARAKRQIHSIIPALKAGIEVWLAVRPSLDEVGAMVDEVPEALLLFDDQGRPVHSNSAMEGMLGEDPGGDRLRTALAELARDFTRARAGSDVHELYSQATTRIIHTTEGVYVARPVAADGKLRGEESEAADGVLLLVRRKQHEISSPPARFPAASTREESGD